ncbi:hypothetical protein GQ55_2G197800 [Panicum hallii var. hallii]|uniref:Uncharacterized protein n=1 Tax=Panicum hallii var. hallii TaxID=1504633 RepID=A0A2T7EQK1_9POAL|nr:hypothetical protein GQ55_2G197800 [Panicum hallii var. hallii]
MPLRTVRAPDLLPVGRAGCPAAALGTFFMDTFIMAAWEIWKMRDAVIFDGARPTVQLWTVRFKEQILLQLIRYREDHRLCISQWLDSVL